MADIPTREPEIFAAGDSLIFQRTLPDYPPAEGWSIIGTLTDSAGVPQANFESAASGAAHLVSEDGFAATLEPGDYVLSEFAVKGAERHRVYYGQLVLQANLGDAAVDEPQTTHAQRMIPILEASLEALEAQGTLVSADVQRSAFVWEQRDKTLNRLNQYREKRANEINQSRVANGRANANNLLPVFRG